MNRFITSITLLALSVASLIARVDFARRHQSHRI
jgi:hypothetical protein